MRAAVSRPFYIARFLIEIGDPAIFLPFCRCTCRGTFTIHQHKGALYKEVHIYGIFQQRSNRSSDPRHRTGCRSRHLGSYQLLEGYGNDNPGAKSQGMKQLMAGGGVALIGTTLVPLLSGLFG